MARELPDYAKPPLIEVVLGLQFEPLQALRAPHLGLLWERHLPQFKKLEERPALEPIVERFVPEGGLPGEVRLEVLDAPPLNRYWFVDESGNQVIQVQQDRLLHNWRKVGEADEYPRYEAIRALFRAELEAFAEFLAQMGLGRLKPNQCEVTYVNHVKPSSVWSRHGQLGSVLTVLRQQYSDSFLAEPEDARLHLRYRIPDSAGRPVGRLHVSASPAIQRTQREPFFRIELTARGEPRGESLDGVFDFLDLGREWIVRGFTSITTPEMHQEWRRLDV